MLTQLVGCDWGIQSDAVEDSCGICHGDGSTCNKVTTSFEEESGNGKKIQLCTYADCGNSQSLICWGLGIYHSPIEASTHSGLKALVFSSLVGELCTPTEGNKFYGDLQFCFF